MGFIRSIVRPIEAMSEAVGRVVCWLIPVMVLVLMIEVIMRYCFKRPTLWAYDTSIFMYGYCGLFAGCYTLKHKSHIVVDVVFNMFKPRTKAILNCCTGILFFIFLLVFIKYTWDMAMVAWEGGHRGNTAWAPPIGHYRLIIPISAGLLLLQGIATWLRNFYFACTGTELDPGDFIDPDDVPGDMVGMHDQDSKEGAE